ncbi:TonB-dependent receptor (plasmid) [Bartonella sp. HY329]|uniref:TonB-dependent receptor n=1 Tax=unclassified Bartonella TaxID=2645622 RepID=UPI0021C9A543|nr:MULTISPECIES: TonB-dependent receptor [unclassified Bartonella]UXM96453.1 TonB-dependent receptor [Bartonella sp. HY329]UXN10776.1 TonB-dependent receptor [Bartonella sp. HY328]
MKYKLLKGGNLGCAIVALLSTSHISAFAQDTVSVDSNSTTLDAIIITGEKIDRDIRNTASSVSVITAKDIWKSGFNKDSIHDSIDGLANVITTDTVAAPIIRGQDSQGPNVGGNAFFGGTIPRASMNIDGHYANYHELTSGSMGIWDVESVEVFKGPQTTSQGANAIGGAIIVNTKDPTFNREAAYQSLIGNYSQQHTSLMASGPIYKNELAGRIALDYSRRDTFIDYVNPLFLTEGTNQNFRYFNGRGKLLWQPAELPGLDVKLTYSRIQSNRPAQEAASEPFFELKHRTNMMPSSQQNSDTAIIDIRYEFENGITLLNKVQYSHFNVERNTGIYTNGYVDVTQNNTSNESRLLFGQQDDKVSGLVGLFYNYVTSDEFMSLAGDTVFDDKKRNLGVFGEVRYRLTDRWTIEGGLRYQNDLVNRKGRSVFAALPLDYEETFSALLPKISLAYALRDDWIVGAVISRGYNPGGVALNMTSRQWLAFKQEKVWNYELFSRLALLDNRLSLNSNIFYMDFKDNQYNIPVVISPGLEQSYTINAEKTHSYGLELGLDYIILDNLQLKTSAGILKTRIDKISSNIAYEGNEFAKSPGFMLSAGLNWQATEKLNLGADIRHVDKYYSDIANTPAYSINAYTLSNFKINYDINQALQVFGYVNNVFNERTPTYLRNNRGTEASMTMPRNYGIGIRGTF